MPHIHVITTGGTIDKVYGLGGHLEVGEPAFEELLAPVRTDVTFDLTPALAVDSLQMTDADRDTIAEAVDAVQGPLVLITHGTDTMADTAAHLHQHLGATDKVVVLTGAMQPAAMRASDASFNLGAAIAALQLLPPGVHIGMSGRVFRADRVVKDRARGVFVEELA